MKAWLRKRKKEEEKETGVLDDQAPWLQEGEGRGFAVAVLAISPGGIPLVRDLRKAAQHAERQNLAPVFWKLPSGKGKPGETKAAAGARELLEESGVDVEQKDLILLSSEDRGSHDYFFFRANLGYTPELAPMGDEGEEVSMFSVEEILRMPDFFPPHRKVALPILADLKDQRKSSRRSPTMTIAVAHGGHAASQ